MLRDFLRIIKGFVLFIGPTQAGKTSILRRLVTGKFEDPEPTLGFREENIAKVRVIEIGGQLEFKKHWGTAIEQKPVWIFYVVDITRHDEFGEFEEFVAKLEAVDSGIRKKITLVLNKVDKLEGVTKTVPPSNSITCSAKTGEGMIDLLEEVASNKDAIASDTSDLGTVTTEEVSSNDQKGETDTETLLNEYKDKF
ncbi:MAG: ADP-ribosylation factor-like protein [Candidatus Heimdallarchaeota archaeon]